MKRGNGDIRDYALLGNCHSTALLSRDGSIDWCCWPRFDSPPVFCRLLDSERGGYFRWAPEGPCTTTRRYVPGTNILETTFVSDRGSARRYDFFAMDESTLAGLSPADSAARQYLVSLIEGLSGTMRWRVAFRPTPQFANHSASLEPVTAGIAMTAGEPRLRVHSSVALKIVGDGIAEGEHTLGAGERVGTVTGERRAHVEDFDPWASLKMTTQTWTDWARHCTYDGPHKDVVLRSALALKLLTYAPTGAVIAAPTTSLPEATDGSRNWDYRYAWFRDAGLVISSLEELGFEAEGRAFFAWLKTIGKRTMGTFPCMVTVAGSHVPHQSDVKSLRGYHAIGPVRVGNQARTQRQTNVLGELVNAVYVACKKFGSLSAPTYQLMGELTDAAAATWKLPDHGIWEMPKAAKHYLFSKLYCWVALDRAAQLAKDLGDVEKHRKWAAAAHEVRQAILQKGYNATVGAFTESLGSTHVNASGLLVPLVDLLPPGDPRVQSTVRVIREHLCDGPWVRRYNHSDGLAGHEGAFLLCSFWLIDNLALAGNFDEANDYYSRVLAKANDVGLFPEELVPDTGEFRGNFPQAFTHLGVVRTALRLTDCRPY